MNTTSTQNAIVWVKDNLTDRDLARVIQSKRPKKKLISMLPLYMRNGECNYEALVKWIRECRSQT